MVNNQSLRTPNTHTVGRNFVFDMRRVAAAAAEMPRQNRIARRLLLVVVVVVELPLMLLLLVTRPMLFQGSDRNRVGRADHQSGSYQAELPKGDVCIYTSSTGFDTSFIFAYKDPNSAARG